jgi:hypothetical protein
MILLKGQLLAFFIPETLPITEQLIEEEKEIREDMQLNYLALKASSKRT